MPTASPEDAWHIARRLVPGVKALFDDVAQLTERQRIAGQSRRFNSTIREYEALSRKRVEAGSDPLPCLDSNGRLINHRLADRIGIDRAQIGRWIAASRGFTYPTAKLIVTAISDVFDGDFINFIDFFDMGDEEDAARWLCFGGIEGPPWDDFRWTPNPGREAVISDLRHVAQLSTLDEPLSSRLRLGLPHPEVEWSDIEGLSSREWTPKGNATWYDNLRKPLSEPISKRWPKDVPVVTWWDAVAVAVERS